MRYIAFKFSAWINKNDAGSIWKLPNHIHSSMIPFHPFGRAQRSRWPWVDWRAHAKPRPFSSNVFVFVIRLGRWRMLAMDNHSDRFWICIHEMSSTCCAFLVVWEYVWDTLPKHRFRCLARACRAKLRRAHEQSSEAAKHSCKWETVWQFHSKWTNEVAAATSSFYCPLAPPTTNAEITSCA